MCLKHPAMSDSLHPHGWQPTRLLCPWDFPGKNTAVGCHSLLQRIFAGIKPVSPGSPAFSLRSEPPANPRCIQKCCLTGPLQQAPPTNCKTGPVSSGQFSFTVIKRPRTGRQGGKADKILALNKPEFDSWFCAFWHDFLISVKQQQQQASLNGGCKDCMS